MAQPWLHPQPVFGPMLHSLTSSCPGGVFSRFYIRDQVVQPVFDGLLQFLGLGVRFPRYKFCFSRCSQFLILPASSWLLVTLYNHIIIFYDYPSAFFGPFLIRYQDFLHLRRYDRCCSLRSTTPFASYFGAVAAVCFFWSIRERFIRAPLLARKRRRASELAFSWVLDDQVLWDRLFSGFCIFFSFPFFCINIPLVLLFLCYSYIYVFLYIFCIYISFYIYTYIYIYI